MKNGLRHFYEFGPFRIDPYDRTLFREGKPVPLTPKSFDMLLVLVENRGCVVSKGDLLNRVWPDAAVEEANLSVTSSSSGSCRSTISTKAGISKPSLKGYRFAAAVDEPVDETATAQNEDIRERFVGPEDENSARDGSLDLAPRPSPVNSPRLAGDANGRYSLWSRLS